MYTGKRTDPPSRAWLILALIALAVVLTALGVFAALILRQPSAQPPQPSPSLAPALSAAPSRRPTPAPRPTPPPPPAAPGRAALTHHQKV